MKNSIINVALSAVYATALTYAYSNGNELQAVWAISVVAFVSLYTLGDIRRKIGV